MKVLLIILIVLLLIGFIRFGGTVEYSSEGLTVLVKILCFNIKVLPRPEKTPEQQAADEEKKKKAEEKKKKAEAKRKAKEEKRKAKAEKKAQKKKKQPEEDKKPKKGGSLQLILKMIPAALETLGDLKNVLRFDELYVHYTIAGQPDPAGAARQYGMICAGGGAVTALLENNLRIRKREVSAWVDFTTTEALVYVRLTITMSVGRLLRFVVAAGIKFLRIYLADRQEKKHKSKQEGQ
ncbi:MAG: hypothetical protein LIO70_02175 [Clostridiales bacterium]|nr:hypothetical protein [Clostridiales bacterium]MCD7856952.1 hypothetical protein [Clostridiales bacterium]